MNCGYLYEIRRKSEDFESTQRPQHVHLRTFSEEEDDDVWVVPEESFDNAYQTIGENEDDDGDGDGDKNEDGDDNVGDGDDGIPRKTTSNKNPSNILQNFEIFSAQRLRLSLSAEQISLKSQQQQWENTHKTDTPINKSINTETDVQARPVVVVGTHSSSASSNATTIDVGKPSDHSSTVKWKNVKINNKCKENEPNTTSTHLSGIPLIPLILNQTQKQIPNETQVLPELKLSLNNLPITLRKRSNNSESTTISLTRKSESSRKLSLGSVSMQRPHIDLGPQADYYNSPESIVDNILSDVSSVSVQSSSLSSDILTNDCEELKFKNNNPFKVLDDNCANNTKINLLEHNAIISDKRSNLNRCCQQAAAEHPCIMVTQPSPSTSSSTIINEPLSVTSSESYETAATISR